MAGPSATLRRSMISIAAAVGAGTLLAVVRSPSISDPDQEEMPLGVDDGRRADPYDAYVDEEGHRPDPYDRYLSHH